MSDFISRLAARAVARIGPPPIVPAVPETVVETPTPAPPEVAREQPVVRATPAAPAVRSEAPEARPDPAQPRERLPHTHAAEPVTHERVVERTVVREVATAAPREQVEGARAAERAPAPAEIVHAAPVAAAPTSVRVLETSVARAPSAPPEEPAVRVHIGRLEVRANLEQPPPPPRHTPTTDTAEGLSLSDYLRGRRSA